MSKREKPDRECIRDFAAFLKNIGRPVNGVDCWPEDEADGEIDAIIGPYAVQHTSVDALPRGREADDWFSKVISDLEEELSGKLGFPLQISWDWAAVQKGQKWDEVRDALRRWTVSDEARKLPYGRQRISGVAGVPFSFQVTKPPLDYDGVRFSRHDPNDATFNARLHDQLAGRHNKLAPLARYRTEGKTALLLLESRDVALMNDGKIIEALEAAFPTRPPDLDEVWFMHYVAPGTVNVHDLRSGAIRIFDLSKRTISLYNPEGPKLTWPGELGDLTK
jgi:hypothetical protein